MVLHPVATYLYTQIPVVRGGASLRLPLLIKIWGPARSRTDSPSVSGRTFQPGVLQSLIFAISPAVHVCSSNRNKGTPDACGPGADAVCEERECRVATWTGCRKSTRWDHLLKSSRLATGLEPKSSDECLRLSLLGGFAFTPGPELAISTLPSISSRGTSFRAGLGSFMGCDG